MYLQNKQRQARWLSHGYNCSKCMNEPDKTQITGNSRTALFSHFHPRMANQCKPFHGEVFRLYRIRLRPSRLTDEINNLTDLSLSLSMRVLTDTQFRITCLSVVLKESDRLGKSVAAMFYLFMYILVYVLICLSVDQPAKLNI